MKSLASLLFLLSLVVPAPGQFDFTDIAFMNNSSTLRRGLVAYYQLEEASGTRYAVYGTNHLTDVNTVTQNPGAIDNGAQLTLANSERLESLVITNNGNPLALVSPFTVSCWCYMDTKTAPEKQIIIFNNSAATFESFRVRYWSTPDRFQFVFGSNAAVSLNANALGSPSTATWYHILCWHEGTTASIRINGGATNTASTAATGVTANYPAFLRVGCGLANQFWNGRIDEIAFWNRVLTSTEQTAIYTNSASGVRARRYPF